jgi:hypothetical protein
MKSTKLSRRSLLQAGIQAGAGLAAAPFLAGFTQEKIHMSKLPITGEGDHTYEVIHDWLTPPKNVLFGDTHGLALDKHGHIYVAHTVHEGSVGSEAVCVYDQKGKLVNAWGAEFRGGAHGLDLRQEGSEEFLYHCDTNRRLVVKTTLEGKVVWSKGMPTEPGVYNDHHAFVPTNVAFAPNGDLFVGDGYGSSYIHQYTKDGDYVKLICGPGKEKGQVSCPHGLWVDSRDGQPKLIVADRGNRRIQYLTLGGEHISFLTDGLRMPCHIHFNRKGEMLVPDLEHVVTILDKQNKPIVHLGDGPTEELRDVPREKMPVGKFVHPHSAIWINKNDILVAEWVPIGRLTLLRKVS